MATPTSARASRRIRLTPRLDTKPMLGVGLVLAALLLAAKPIQQTVLQLTMPSRSHKQYLNRFPASDGLTLLLGRQHQIHYYRGGFSAEELPKLQTIRNGYPGLRRLLLESRYRNPKVVVLIKPGPGAKYRDLVDALDEMNITDQRKYAVVDLQKLDYALLRQNGL
ncbi:biopolymer transporter ExbD [Hymenobacter chitinivorans]|uniref:Biopolymer transport protein ExbD/TolR n=1 Tax=Hymenobacter chitinivorans DSM 11115 TaxID=1121954 RepID=A0A2M9B564_9BACT|nr:biopolymer transporter ExbD [Hymenobacter chitinivorans]PJJ53097.1 biopolymer transport protein ExbD/TolR [Hymenobacter chitinivorans DSM 11115]